MLDLLSSEKCHIKIDVSNKHCHICTSGRMVYEFPGQALVSYSRGRSLTYNIKAVYLFTRLINYAKVKKYWLASSQPQYKAVAKENTTLSDRFLHKTENKNERVQDC